MSMLFRAVVISLAGLLLLACSKITEENFARIETGMSLAEVEAILGKADSTDISGGLGLTAGTASWRDGKGRISITLAQDKVILKDYSAH